MRWLTGAGGMRPLHVMFIVHGFNVGGLENVVAHLVNHCSPERFRFSICSMTQLGGARDRVHRADTKFHAMNKGPGNDWSLIFRIAQLIKNDPVDIIQTHEWGTYLEGLFAARLAKAPVCIHVEQGTPHWHYRRQRVAYRLAQRLTDRFVPVSEQLAGQMRRWLKIAPSKLTVIGNAIETDRFPDAPERRGAVRAGLKLSDRDFVIGTVGRLVPVKGYEILLQSIARLKALGVPARLLLIGNGPLYEPLQRLVETWDLQQHVQFLGERADIPDLLQALDVYVSSSLSEGRSLSIMEAMAAGLPVVATSVGGTPEIITDGHTGVLVPPMQPDALSEKLLILIMDPLQRARLGAAARRSARESFNVQSMVEAYQNLYIMTRMKTIVNYE